RRHTRSDRDWSSDVCSSDLDGKQSFDRSQFKDANGPVTAETLYLNQKVSDLISNAEMEQSDYRGERPNVFFGEEKRYLGMKVDRSEERRVGKEGRFKGGGDH